MVNTSTLHRIYSIPERSAREAGLHYLLDETPGLSRERRGRGFIYKDQDGRPLSSKTDVTRIKSLRIPPAWTDVWISPVRNAHLLATGRDERGRKQYIYHPKWNELRNILKYYRLILFAESLPVLRQAMRRGLGRKGMPEQTGLPRERVLAAVLSLMDKLSIRVGNEEYAKTNKTYGLTTLRDNHADIQGGTIKLHFTGKSNIRHEIKIEDAELARVVKKSKDVTGRRLFQYIDKENNRHPITSNEVNTYIQSVTGYDFTAKDFRTWAASVRAFELMKRECKACALATASQTVRNKKAREILSAVAEKLGNTVAVCRSHYVHSDLQDIFTKGEFTHRVGGLPKLKTVKGLSAVETEFQYLLSVLHRERVASFLS